MKTKPKHKRRIWIPLLILAAVILLIAALVPVVVPAVGKWFTSQETAVRDAWAVDVGDLIGVDETQQIEIRHAPVESSITVLQLVPTDIEDEGFTYYDTAVQQRVRAMLDRGQQISGRQVQWTAETPLAMLDPFGRRDVLETVRRLNKEKGITVVWITHYMEEAVQADRILVVSDGQIVKEGTPREIFRQVDALRELHLDVPPMTALSAQLREAGMPLPDGVLTVEEMAEEVAKLLCPSK